MKLQKRHIVARAVLVLYLFASAIIGFVPDTELGCGWGIFFAPGVCIVFLAVFACLLLTGVCGVAGIVFACDWLFGFTSKD